MMREDQLMKEIRKIRRRIFVEECGGDLEKFIRRARKAQEKLKDRLRSPRR